jgi:hypothetical protein
MQIDRNQMAALLLAVYLDINKRWRFPEDQERYDTPFWDATGKSKGSACFSGNCYNRTEVNYFAQGMYDAANWDPELYGEGKIWAWKIVMYQKRPSEGTLFWHSMGYMIYNMLQGK